MTFFLRLKNLQVFFCVSRSPRNSQKLLFKISSKKIFLFRTVTFSDVVQMKIFLQLTVSLIGVAHETHLIWLKRAFSKVSEKKKKLPQHRCRLLSFCRLSRTKNERLQCSQRKCNGGEVTPQCLLLFLTLNSISICFRRMTSR
jgi:hypothetical protein